MSGNRRPDEPGYIDSGEDDIEAELADVDLGYRGRGRPRLPPEQRRREKLIISLTADELRSVMLRAANEKPVPLSPNDWARRELLALANRKDGE